MRFLMLVRPPQDGDSGPPKPDCAERVKDVAEEMRKAGVLVMTDALMPMADGAVLRSEAEKITVVDGPFAEAKELVGGFAIIEAGSKAEAIEMGQRFLAIAGDGILEIRQMVGASA